MKDTKTRVRWTESEKRALAAELVRLEVAEPALGKMQALGHAQLHLPEGRRRQVPTWAAVRDLLERYLAEAKASAAAEPTHEQAAGDTHASAAGQGGEPAKAVSPADRAQPENQDDAVPAAADRPQASPAASADATAVAADPAAEPERVADGQLPAATTEPTAHEPSLRAAVPALRLEVSHARAASAALDPAAGSDAPSPFALAMARAIEEQFHQIALLGARSIEQALLGALSSDAVAERVSRLVDRAVEQAAQRLVDAAARAGTSALGVAARESRTTSQPAVEPTKAAPHVRPKILVIGLEPPQANEVAEALSDKLDMRYWRVGETLDQLRSQARVCSVAVIVSEDSQPQLEALLKPTHVRIVRHSGGVKRLRERLVELLEGGMFNLLT